MLEARLNGQLVKAGPDTAELAFCPICGGEVKKRRRRGSAGKVTYFYRHKMGVGNGCPRRYRPVA